MSSNSTSLHLNNNDYKNQNTFTIRKTSQENHKRNTLFI